MAACRLRKALIPAAELENETSQARGIGVVLSAHVDETFTVETDDPDKGPTVLRLSKKRARFPGGKEPEVRYLFAVVEQEGGANGQAEA